jgi:hypothetical protein
MIKEPINQPMNVLFMVINISEALPDKLSASCQKSDNRPLLLE